MTDRGVELGRRDPVARLASEPLGGPAGSRALPLGTGWRRVAALLGLGAVIPLVLDILQKNNCVAAGWRQPDQLWRACYADLPVVWSGSGISTGAFPWSSPETGLSVPVGRGLWMWLTGLVVPDGSTLARQQGYFAVWVAVLTLALMASIVMVTLLTRRTTRDGSAGWAAAHLALSPVLVTTAFVSDDLLVLALLLTGVTLWSRGAWVWAALVWAVAAWASPWAVFVPLAAILAACAPSGWRDTRTLADPPSMIGRPEGIGTALVVIGALAGLVLPWAVRPEALQGYASVWSSAPGFGALQKVPALLGHPLPQAAVNGIAVGGWILAALAGLLRSGLLPVGPVSRPPRGGGLATVTIMLTIVWLTAPTVPVQTALWWLPLFALARVPWRVHLTFALVEAVHFTTVWLNAGLGADPNRGLPDVGYAMVVIVRMLVWVWACWWVVRCARRG